MNSPKNTLELFYETSSFKENYIRYISLAIHVSISPKKPETDQQEFHIQDRMNIFTVFYDSLIIYLIIFLCQTV